MLKRRLEADRYVLAVGQQLRGEQTYTIEAVRGGGAFSVGYRARDSEGRDCFVKEYLPALHPRERSELRRLFAQECDVLRRLGSYELCPRLWEAFETCGFQYLVQDYIPGEDLESLLAARTRFDQETLVRWSLALCHATAFLHSRNVVHHDLKPANVRMNADGDPVLLDFGAARWYRSADEKSEILYGTEGYLAPESATQGVEDLAAGMRIDVYALGRMLVEMMIGKRLTQAEIEAGPETVYGSFIHRESLDIGFRRALFRSVSHKQEVRYASALEMEKDLEKAAPPIARRKPAEIDLGVAFDTRPREAIINVYNVGGGKLAGEVSTDGDWLEVGAADVSTSRRQSFDRNRQSVRVVAFPERLHPGAAAQGRVTVSCPTGSLGTTVALRRAVDISQIVVQPDELKLTVKPKQAARANLTFRNRGQVAVRVRITPHGGSGIAVAPESFQLMAGGQMGVVVTAEAAALGENGTRGMLAWSVEGVDGPGIPVEVQVKSGGGLMSGLRRGKGN